MQSIIMTVVSRCTSMKAAIASIVGVLVFANPQMAHAVTRILRVDAQNGLNNPTGTPGDSWTNAYKYLRDAIARAVVLNPTQSDPVEIRVRGATGAGLTYRTDENAVNQSGTNSRSDTFALREHVKIFGQYIGGTGGSAETRDPTYLTILSGEIQTGAITDNAFHVVTADRSGITDNNCRLEGFTIRDGHSTLPPDSTSYEGAGIHISDGADPRIDHCRITANYAVTGGGVFVRGSDPVITNCVIADNAGFDHQVFGEDTFCAGGGIFVIHSASNNATVNLIDTQILDNWVQGSGGGLMCEAFFSDNRKTYVKLVNCLVARNEAEQVSGPPSGLGGGILIQGAGTEGAIGEFINCTIVDNDAWRGGGLYVRNSGTTDDSLLKNSIVWGNEVTEQGKEIYVKDSELQATSNDVRNRLDSDYVDGNTVVWVSGNIGENVALHNPHFIDFTGGDYRLQCVSLAVDHGSNGLVPCDLYDVDNDSVTCGGSTEPTPDLDLSTRVTNSTVDMGAFEKAASYPCPGDANGDCHVNADDLVIVILEWNNSCALCRGDVNPHCGDGMVNADDLTTVILNWTEEGVPCPGCIATGVGAGATIEDYEDCVELCSSLSGEDAIACMQACFAELCRKGLTAYCD